MLRNLFWRLLVGIVILSACLGGWRAGDRGLITFAPPLAGSTVILENDGGHGSGVYLGNGIVLTAAHVVGKQLRMRTDHGGTSPVTTMWVDKLHDLAAVRIDDARESARIQSAELSCKLPKEGDELTFAGNPVDVEFVKTFGRVAGPPVLFAENPFVIPVSGTIIQGMSGGPAFDKHGRVVGINVMVILTPVQGGPRMLPMVADGGIGFIAPTRTLCLMMGRA